ncbi:MAG: exosortase/archaeosortase family protein [Candidatus Hodarchaeota archaeon]
MNNEVHSPFWAIVADWPKALIGLSLVVVTIPLYIEFETSRNLFVAISGIFAFSLGIWLLSNEVLPLARYRPILLPFTAGLFFFMLWLESPLNDALLESELAKIQIRMTTIMSTAIYSRFLLIMLLSIAATVIGLLTFRWKAAYFPNLQEIPWIFLLISIASWLVIGMLEPNLPDTSFLASVQFQYTILDNGNAQVFFPEGSKSRSLTIDGACSGIHSLALFGSSFYIALMYFYEHYNPQSGRLLAGFLIGTLGTLSANWVRIAIIYWIGYYRGSAEMLAFHDYAGLAIFLSWMLVFWMKSIDWMLEPIKIGMASKHEQLAPASIEN